MPETPRVEEERYTVGQWGVGGGEGGKVAVWV